MFIGCIDHLSFLLFIKCFTELSKPLFVFFLRCRSIQCACVGGWWGVKSLFIFLSFPRWFDYDVMTPSSALRPRRLPEDVRTMCHLTSGGWGTDLWLTDRILTVRRLIWSHQLPVVASISPHSDSDRLPVAQHCSESLLLLISFPMSNVHVQVRPPSQVHCTGQCAAKGPSTDWVMVLFWWTLVLHL